MGSPELVGDSSAMLPSFGLRQVRAFPWLGNLVSSTVLSPMKIRRFFPALLLSIGALLQLSGCSTDPFGVKPVVFLNNRWK